MRSRGIVLAVSLILTTLVAACAPIPGLPAPTAAPVTAAPVSSPVITPETIATLAAPVTQSPAEVAPTLAITSTAVAPGEAIATPRPTAVVPVTGTVTVENPSQGGAIEPVSTYRDDFAGFEIDYPASWSVVDVAQDIKQQSTSYSITFMSWKRQEPGGQGIPEGGSKLDLSVTKGGATSPEAAAESRRQELTAEGAGSQITFEEPWDLTGGLTGTHLTVQASSGERVQEFVTAINGNRIVVSGMGDPSIFEQIAMSLRPVSTAARALTMPAPSESQAAETPVAQAEKQAVVPVTPAAEAATLAQPLAATVYTVRQGDTLAKIAARFGVTVAAILRANPRITNADRIFVGQRITIPTSGGTQPPPAGTTRVDIYLIGMGGGNVGCGDQAVAVRRDVPRTAAPLTAALNLLLAQKSQYYGQSGLYNALYQSDLHIASISRTGTAWTIRLAGTLRLGGVCDNPRVKAQLEQTALQFSTVQSVRYFINGQELDAILSEK